MAFNPSNGYFKICACGGRLGCIDSRSVKQGEYVRRRYKCAKCGERITTVEIKLKTESELEHVNVKRFVKYQTARACARALNRILEAVQKEMS